MSRAIDRLISAELSSETAVANLNTKLGDVNSTSVSPMHLQDRLIMLAAPLAASSDCTFICLDRPAASTASRIVTEDVSIEITAANMTTLFEDKETIEAVSAFRSQIKRDWPGQALTERSNIISV